MLPKLVQLLQPGATPDKMPRRQLFSMMMGLLPLLVSGQSGPEETTTVTPKKTGYGTGAYGG